MHSSKKKKKEEAATTRRDRDIDTWMQTDESDGVGVHVGVALEGLRVRSAKGDC